MPSILQKPQNKKNKVQYQKRKTKQYRKQGSRSKYNEIINNLINNGSNTPRTLF
jgi:hypothetical protein